MHVSGWNNPPQVKIPTNTAPPDSTIILRLSTDKILCRLISAHILRSTNSCCLSNNIKTATGSFPIKRMTLMTNRFVSCGLASLELVSSEVAKSLGPWQRSRHTLLCQQCEIGKKSYITVWCSNMTLNTILLKFDINFTISINKIKHVSKRSKKIK